jgi:hypothetical protein
VPEGREVCAAARAAMSQKQVRAKSLFMEPPKVVGPNL